jgi:hypothetical protein
LIRRLNWSLRQAGSQAKPAPGFSHQNQEGYVKLKRSALGALSVVALVGSSLAIGAASAGAIPVTIVTKVTICHRTNSDTNPYVVITPDVSGVRNGHAKKHDEPRIWAPGLKAQHLKWGDIIPPFTDATGFFPGLNMASLGGVSGTATGAQFLANNCEDPGVPNPPVQHFGDLKITKVVTGQVSGNPTPTSFTVHVECDDDSVNEDYTFAGIVGGVKTYTGIKEGILCTVVELDTATFSTGTVVTYSPAATEGAEIEIVKDTVNQVTVTNAFPPPAVQPADVVKPAVAPVAVAPAAVTVSPALTG